MLPRTVEWIDRKTHSPAVKGGDLGWGVEYWDSDPTHYEDWEAVRDRLMAVSHKRPPQWKLAYELSEHLLDDVLAAAGGWSERSSAFEPWSPNCSSSAMSTGLHLPVAHVVV